MKVSSLKACCGLGATMDAVNDAKRRLTELTDLPMVMDGNVDGPMVAAVKRVGIARKVPALVNATVESVDTALTDDPQAFMRQLGGLNQMSPVVKFAIGASLFGGLYVLLR